MATPSTGVATLLAAPSGHHAEFFPVVRAIAALRDIGLAPDLETARRAALAMALGVDVVVVTLQDELVRLDERAVAAGVEMLADIGVPVLLLTGFGNEGPDDFARASGWLRKGVRGVLSIDASYAELSASARAVRAGLVVVEPRVAQVALSSPRRRASAGAKPPSRAPGDVSPLSTREREVLALLATGLATKQIAYELGISTHTVKAHVESIFAKFGATTRAEAVAIGVRRGEVML